MYLYLRLSISGRGGEQRNGAIPMYAATQTNTTRTTTNTTEFNSSTVKTSTHSRRYSTLREQLRVHVTEASECTYQF